MILQQAEAVRQTATGLPHTMPNTRWWLLEIYRKMLRYNQPFHLAAQNTSKPSPDDPLWH
jgi:hypothetical protein